MRRKVLLYQSTTRNEQLIERVRSYLDANGPRPLKDIAVWISKDEPVVEGILSTLIRRGAVFAIQPPLPKRKKEI